MSIAEQLEGPLLDGLSRGGRVVLRGARGGHLALLLARLASKLERRPALGVLVADEDAASALVSDIAFFLAPAERHPSLDLPEVMHLPEVETSPYAETAADRATTQVRMAVLARLTGDARLPAGRVLVTSLAALRRRTLPHSTFTALVERVVAGDEIERDLLAERLVDAGYSNAKVVEDPGTFCVRGG
ncbi:MAG: transcription-repair coupling factor, partial [Myxococcales bacterium]|nr:transcription-repair coupling factor [Myxococcales bacterium]